MTPAREMGGDFYDFFPLDDGRLSVVMADVSGKGVPAAFFMAIARTVMRAAAARHRHSTPGPCLQEVNDAICEQNPQDLFVTLFYGILNPASWRVHLRQRRAQPALHRPPPRCGRGAADDGRHGCGRHAGTALRRGRGDAGVRETRCSFTPTASPRP